MITKTLLIAALAIVAAGSSLANEVTPETFGNFKSTLTRAEVTAEYVRAKQTGELAWANNFYNPAAQRSASTLTRAEVMAEVVRARNAGEISAATLGFTPLQLQRAVQ